MEEILFILAKTVQVTLSLVFFTMCVRSITPLFVNPEESRLYAISCYITEPFVIPTRFILAKLNVGQNTPIDVAFLVSSLIIWLLVNLLPTI